MAYSVSCTTRAPRPGEVDGKHYFFLPEQEFRKRIEAGFFLEYAQVHGHWYGTPLHPIEQSLEAGKDVILAIDVQGAGRIRTLISGAALAILKMAFVDVFIIPPSIKVLKQRLEGRGQDAEETIRRRLADSEQELACWQGYRYAIVNDKLDEAYARLRAIIEAEHCRVMPEL